MFHRNLKLVLAGLIIALGIWQIIDKNIEEVNWIDLKDLSPDLMTLPVDKIVVEKLLKEIYL